jgi:hypothetical protein
LVLPLVLHVPTNLNIVLTAVLTVRDTLPPLSWQRLFLPRPTAAGCATAR